jgi:hypothetical protein
MESNKIVCCEVVAMITLDECRRTLGPKYRDWSDEDLTVLRARLYALAQIAVDAYLEKKSRTDGAQAGEKPEPCV